MENHYEKIAKILRTSSDVLMDLEMRMNILTGKEKVIERISEENDMLVKRTLQEMGFLPETFSKEVYDTLVARLGHLDKELYEALGRPDLSKMSNVCGLMCETALKVTDYPQGLFLKKQKAAEFLEKTPPKNLLSFFGYNSVSELLANENILSVFAALRFTEPNDWMKNEFIKSYETLTIDDFEQRPVEVMVLDEKYVRAAEKFLEKKYHNVSHLKEMGFIFVVPVKIDSPGETTRIYTLLLHYLNEVPFYSKLFKAYGQEPNFAEKTQSLLRGDVLEVDKINEIKQKAESGRFVLPIIQRYLAKDDPSDPRLLMPHINPEAEHWEKAQASLSKLSSVLPESDFSYKGISFSYWHGLDFVGGFFKNESGNEDLVSFDLIDLIMSLVKKGQVKYLYHQQEALWNKIFVEYLGREKLNQLIEENIIQGYIQL